MNHPQYMLANGSRTTVNASRSAGTFGSGGIPATGAGPRFMWYPGKAAIRAGLDQATSGGTIRVGRRQHRAVLRWVRHLSVASGFASVAIGATNKATGLGSVAIGYGGSATGAIAMALGSTVQANADYSTVMGSFARADHVARSCMVTATRALPS